MSEADVDSMLVERVRLGEAAAFELLVRRYQTKVVAIIHRLVRDRAECEDLAQETFLRVYRAIGQFRGESSFYTWIYRIALNTAKNHLAASGRRVATSDVGVDLADQFSDAASLRDRATPEREFLREEIERAVVASMQALPAEIRRALSLREIEGKTYEEIAQIMNCPVGTVRSRIFRGREAVDKHVRPLLEQI